MMLVFGCERRQGLFRHRKSSGRSVHLRTHRHARRVYVVGCVLGLLFGLTPVGQATAASPEELIEQALRQVPDPPILGSSAVAQSGPITTVSDGDTQVSVEQIGPGTVRIRPDGFQAFRVLSSSRDRAFWRITLRGVYAQPASDGGFDLRDSAGDLRGRIGAPWAVDATGRSLSSSYSLSQNGLVQEIDTRGAVFPIVADPWVSFGWFIYWHYTRDDVSRLIGWGLAWAGTYAALTMICSMLPAPYSAACATLSVFYISSIRNTFVYASQNGMCVELRFTYYPYYLVDWKPYRC